MQVSEILSCPVEHSGEKWNEMVNRGDEKIQLAWPWVGTHTCRGDSERDRYTRLHGQCSLSFHLLSLYMVWFLGSLKSSLKRDCMAVATSVSCSHPSIWFGD
jgi:hypothetical protein